MMTMQHVLSLNLQEAKFPTCQAVEEISMECDTVVARECSKKTYEECKVPDCQTLELDNCPPGQVEEDCRLKEMNECLEGCSICRIKPVPGSDCFNSLVSKCGGVESQCQLMALPLCRKVSREECTPAKSKRWVCDDLDEEKIQALPDISGALDSLGNLLAGVGALTEPVEVDPEETEVTPKVKRHNRVTREEQSSAKVKRHTPQDEYIGPKVEDFMVDARLFKEETDRKRLKGSSKKNKMFAPLRKIREIQRKTELEHQIKSDHAKELRTRRSPEPLPEPTGRRKRAPIPSPEPTGRRKRVPIPSPEPTGRRKRAPIPSPEPTGRKTRSPEPLPEPTGRRRRSPLPEPSPEPTGRRRRALGDLES